MRKLLFLKTIVFYIFNLLNFSCYSQNQESGAYVAFSPNIQFVSNLDRNTARSLKTYPFIGGFLNFGYSKIINKNIFTDICLGYNVKSYKYNYSNYAKGTDAVSKIEADINIGYINQINEKKDLLVHLGYGMDFFGTKDTLFFTTTNLTTLSFGTEKPNVYLEIGFGIFHHKLLRNFYTGISFKKGFVKSSEMQFYYNENNFFKFSNVVSYQDNLSFNLKYYFRHPKKIVKG